MIDHRKYLKTSNDFGGDSLLEQAARVESTRELLVTKYHLIIPEHGSTSIKLHCPWGIEHKDRGKEKSMRYYYDTDTAFCFRDHGVVDSVVLRADLWGVSRTKAARSMLEKAGLLKREHWSRRMKTMLEQEEVKSDTNVSYAFSALNSSLSQHSEYLRSQYKKPVVKAKQRCLDAFNPAWSMDSVLKWIETSTAYIMRFVDGKA